MRSLYRNWSSSARTLRTSVTAAVALVCGAIVGVPEEVVEHCLRRDTLFGWHTDIRLLRFQILDAAQFG